jgi:hypothetical protein
MNAPELAERAMLHIRHLAGEIGPRPAGSEQERLAFDYLAACLDQAGLKVERQPVPFAPSMRFSPPFILAALAMLAGSLFLESLPWLGLLLPLLFAGLPQIAGWYLRGRRRTAASQNLLAVLGGRADAPLFILCAHVDSAPAGPFVSPLWRRLNYHSMDFIQRSAIAVAALALLRLVGFGLPGILTILVGALGCAAALWIILTQILSAVSRAWSPGAIDNASGAGLLLALAEHYAAHPPDGRRLGFLFSGAEETGMHGAQAFASRLKTQEPAARLLVLDMVGAGERLHYVTADGVFFPLKTDPELNESIRQANPQALPLRYILRSGDHAAFIRQGFATAALQTAGSSAADLAYHTPADTLDLVQPAALEMTARTILALIQNL